MNAKESNLLALSRQSKFEKMKAKKLKRNMNSIHYNIKRVAKKGYFRVAWDYRDCIDRETIKSNLINEGYNVIDTCPYFDIYWGDENEVCHNFKHK